MSDFPWVIFFVGILVGRLTMPRVTFPKPPRRYRLTVVRLDDGDVVADIERQD